MVENGVFGVSSQQTDLHIALQVLTLKDTIPPRRCSTIVHKCNVLHLPAHDVWTIFVTVCKFSFLSDCW